MTELRVGDWIKIDNTSRPEAVIALVTRVGSKLNHLSVKYYEDQVNRIENSTLDLAEVRKKFPDITIEKIPFGIAKLMRHQKWSDHEYSEIRNYDEVN